jgi:hypothetical protein
MQRPAPPDGPPTGHDPDVVRAELVEIADALESFAAMAMGRAVCDAFDIEVQFRRFGGIENTPDPSDTALGAALGYERPRAIRKLIIRCGLPEADRCL